MNNLTDSHMHLSQQIGLLLMTAAATFGMLELPEHPNAKITLASQPMFAYATSQTGGDSHQLRREKEETGAHYISYSTVQRTPGRTGRY